MKNELFSAISLGFQPILKKELFRGSLPAGADIDFALLINGSDRALFLTNKALIGTTILVFIGP